MSNQCCCCHWFKRGVESVRSATTPSQAEMGMIVMEPYTDYIKGHCHRHAPFTLTGKWPVVDENESCGDFSLWTEWT